MRYFFWLAVGLLALSCAKGVTDGNLPDDDGSGGTSSTSTSSSGDTCDPLGPSAVCGPEMHCIPEITGIPSCSGPTGLGTQYADCYNGNADCQDIYQCIETSTPYYWCMQWCTADTDCADTGYPDDVCYGLDPAIYVGSTEWGVCWDGLG